MRFGTLPPVVGRAEGYCRRFLSAYAQTYLKEEVLQDTLVAFAVRPYVRSARKRLTTHPVYHLFDLGYYLDWQNRRADYIKDVLDKLVNWTFASENFAEG